MEAPEFAPADLTSVRWLISGGAPLPLYIIEAYQRRGVVFKQGYGLTEVGVNCFAMTVDESVRKKGSIGKPMMFTQARAAADDGTEVPPNEVGELWLRGPHVCRGYWNNPDATAAALDADGWFHTGDLARRDEEGFYYIAGRKKDMLISGGVNIYPAEIEAVLASHPSVQDVAVIGVPDPEFGEEVKAVVQPAPGVQPGPALAEVLAGHCRAALAGYKVPRSFDFRDDMPRTETGKLQKRLLRDAYWQGADRRI
jgi:fatty-acyl-CoA synthase